MDSPRDSSAGVGWEAGGVRGAREKSTRRTASEHEADKRGWEGRMQGMAGMAEEWRQQQLQAMRCTEGRGGGGGGAPRHGCACEELGGRCHRARDRPRRSGCRAGGPSRNRSRWALCRWKKFHRRGGARGGDKEGVRVGQVWARGVATADGGNAPPGQGQEVSPPPPSRPHTTTPSPHHISTTHTTLAASLLLVAFTVRVLTCSCCSSLLSVSNRVESKLWHGLRLLVCG